MRTWLFSGYSIVLDSPSAHTEVIKHEKNHCGLSKVVDLVLLVQTHHMSVAVLMGS